MVFSLFQNINLSHSLAADSEAGAASQGAGIQTQRPLARAEKLCLIRLQNLNVCHLVGKAVAVHVRKLHQIPIGQGTDPPKMFSVIMGTDHQIVQVSGAGEPTGGSLQIILGCGADDRKLQLRAGISSIPT